jgi:hypothetical protein
MLFVAATMAASFDEGWQFADEELDESYFYPYHDGDNEEETSTTELTEAWGAIPKKEAGEDLDESTFCLSDDDDDEETSKATTDLLFVAATAAASINEGWQFADEEWNESTFWLDADDGEEAMPPNPTMTEDPMPAQRIAVEAVKKTLPNRAQHNYGEDKDKTQQERKEATLTPGQQPVHEKTPCASVAAKKKKRNFKSRKRRAHVGDNSRQNNSVVLTHQSSFKKFFTVALWFSRPFLKAEVKT